MKFETSKRGRPTVGDGKGQPLTMLVPPDMRERIERHRADMFDSRPFAATVRDLIERGLEVAGG